MGRMGLPASHLPHATHLEARLSEGAMAHRASDNKKKKEGVEDESELGDCCSVYYCDDVWFI